MRKSFKKVVATLAASTLALTIAAGIVPNTANASVECSDAGKKAGKAAVDTSGTYHAYFGLQQTETWIFRDAWYNPQTGKDASFAGDASFDKMLTNLDVTDPIPSDGTVTDAEITGNGVYSVGVEGLNGTLAANQDAVLAMVYVSTDIPSSGKDKIQISDVKLAYDGNEQTIPEKVYENADAAEHGIYQFDVVNTYARDKGEYADCPSLPSPRDSIKITFKVSGMDKDNPDAVEATATPKAKADSSSSKKSDSSISTPVVVGIVVVAVVVIAGVVVVVTKKKKK